jgi:tryptophanyl-tRNA synthetase
MSKSYGNTIALFAPPAAMRRQIAGIVTDSRAPGVPKETEGSSLFQLYQAFATPEETAAFRQAFAEGIAWGDAKQQLFERIDREVAPMRAQYDALMAHPERVEDVLQAGAARARGIATPLLREVRHAVGLRSLADLAPTAPKAAKAALPAIKQYRAADGRFHYKLTDAQGRALLESAPFADPKACAQAIAILRRASATDWATPATGARLAPDATEDDAIAALQALQDG